MVVQIRLSLVDASEFSIVDGQNTLNLGDASIGGSDTCGLSALVALQSLNGVIGVG
jgi:hypothetical protein